MNKQRPFLLAVLIMFIAIFVSCKKQNNSKNNYSNTTPSVQCRITNIKMADSRDSEIILDYNSDKKLSSVIYTIPKKQDLFSYNGNLIIKKELDSNGNLSVIDTIVLGVNNLVSTVVSRSALTGKVVSRDTMFYNAQNQLIKGYGFEYGWVRGDAVTIAYGGRIVNGYAYDTSKSMQDGDCLRLRDILTLGVPVFLCKHLCVGEGGDVKYIFDSNGKITSTISYRDTTVYTYKCD